MSLRFFLVILWIVFGCSENLFSQCINIQNCPSALDTTVHCSSLTNNTALWNDPLFSSPVVGYEDLFEGRPLISATAVNTPNCTGPTTVSFELYLDLDGDQIPESVLLSEALPESGKIRFGNIGNPLLGGTLVSYDNRPVTTDQKYRFAIETTVNGNTVSAQLRFNTESAPNTFISADLPCGRHKIKWIFTDAGGSLDTCVQHFNIVDCQSPTVVCVNGISADLLNTNPPSVTIYAQDILQYMEDNVTPSTDLYWGIRKSGTGNGFTNEQSITFDCTELGNQIAELWVMDQYGNANFCEALIQIDDKFNLCSTSSEASMSFCVKNWCDGAMIAGIDTAYLNNSQDPILEITDPTNCSEVFSVDNSGYLLAWMVKKDDMLNGLSVSDAIKILRHLVGVEQVPYPYGYIAADVDNNQFITISDAVNLIRLLAGLPTGVLRDSWTIVDSSSVANTAGGNPFNLSPYWEAPNPVSSHLNVPFTAIKTGDLNCDALPNLVNDETEDRASKVVQLPNTSLQPGQTIEVPLTLAAEDNWLGLQLGLRYDPSLISITGYTSTLDDDELGLINHDQAGKINIVWLNAEAVNFVAGAEIIRLQIKANSNTNLASAISLASLEDALYPVGYDESLSEHLISLGFTTGSNQNIIPGFSVKGPFPNPVAQTGTSFTINTVNTAPAVIDIYDISGRNCYQSVVDLLPGSHQIAIPQHAFNSGSGVYIWQITTQDGTLSGKIVR